jgi:site-specific recombinase XerC
MPVSVEDVEAAHVRAFLFAEEQRTSAASAAVHFRNIRVFFGWLASGGERENPNPMDRVEAPKVTKKARAFFTEEELARLLKTCSGPTFVDRRDTAIMRVFIDTGLRVSGLAGLRYDPDDESANDVFLAEWLAAGGSTDDLMHITGWKTYDMVREYTEARGIARAHNAHARPGPGDRI